MNLRLLIILLITQATSLNNSFSQSKTEKLATFELKGLDQENLVGFVEDQYLVYSTRKQKGYTFEYTVYVVDITTGIITTNVPNGIDMASTNEYFRKYFVVGGQLYALYENNKNKNVTVKRIDGLKNSKATYSSSITVLQYPNVKKEYVFGLELEISKDNKKIAFLATSNNSKEKSNSVYISVFDQDLNKLWEQKRKFIFEKKFRIRATNISLSNSGIVFFVKRLDRDIPVVGLKTDVDVRMYMVSKDKVGEIQVPFDQDETIKDIQYFKKDDKLYALAQSYQELKGEPVNHYYKIFEINKKDFKFESKGKVLYHKDLLGEFVSKYKPVYRELEQKKLETRREIPLENFHFLKIYNHEDGLFVLMKYRDRSDVNHITSDLLICKINFDLKKMDWIKIFPSINEFSNKSTLEENHLNLFYVTHGNTLGYLHEDGKVSGDKKTFESIYYVNNIKIKMANGDSKIHPLNTELNGEFKIGSIQLSKDEKNIYILQSDEKNTYTAYKITI